MTSLRVSWLKAAEISSGPVFRKVDRWGHPGKRALCDKAVALIVKRLAAAAGLDAERYGGHSLRAGPGDRRGDRLVAARLNPSLSTQVAAMVLVKLY